MIDFNNQLLKAPEKVPFYLWPFKRTQKPVVKPEPRCPMVNKAGYNLIRESESLRLKAYLCSAGVWTIGWGATFGLDGFPVSPGDEITQDEARQLFARDVNFFAKGVRKLVKVPLNDNQFSALVSLAFNIGMGRFRASTMLRKLNRGDYAGAEGEFWKWRRANGRILRGLVVRREKERILFATSSRHV